MLVYPFLAFWLGAFNCKATPVGAEYIIMEKVEGVELSAVSIAYPKR
jgi:hypothetical protein